MCLFVGVCLSVFPFFFFLIYSFHWIHKHTNPFVTWFCVICFSMYSQDVFSSREFNIVIFFPNILSSFLFYLLIYMFVFTTSLISSGAEDWVWNLCCLRHENLFFENHYAISLNKFWKFLRFRIFSRFFYLDIF